MGVVCSLVAGLLLANQGPVSAAPNSITQPDAGGLYSSLKLDASGNPVVTHFDPATQKVKVVRCGDANCAGGNTIVAPDDMAAFVAGIAHTSLALSGDVPILTHYDSNPKDLRFVHCGNSSCGSATVRSLDSGPLDTVGIYASIAINSSGNPVVAYYYEPFDVLRLLTCGDATCASYVKQDIDTAPITGLWPSLQLDASGYPVISYYAQTAGDLMLARCANVSCSLRTLLAVDGVSPSIQAGKYSSLALDAAGFPVMSYYNESAGDLRVLHCGDATCSAGNTIASPDTTGNVGQHTSLALDASGRPVVSYYDATGSALKVLRCGNAACASGNSIVTPDAAGAVGQYTSLALDAAGNPVVSYYDATDGRLNLLHCGDPLCVGAADPVGGLTTLPDVSLPGDQAHGSAGWLIGAALLAFAAFSGLYALRRG